MLHGTFEDVRAGLDLLPRRPPGGVGAAAGRGGGRATAPLRPQRLGRRRAPGRLVGDHPHRRSETESAENSFSARHLGLALEAAVRTGTDTDTVAAIAGALLGARWGCPASRRPGSRRCTAGPASPEPTWSGWRCAPPVAGATTPRAGPRRRACPSAATGGRRPAGTLWEWPFRVTPVGGRGAVRVGGEPAAGPGRNPGGGPASAKAAGAGVRGGGGRHVRRVRSGQRALIAAAALVPRFTSVAQEISGFGTQLPSQPCVLSCHDHSATFPCRSCLGP
ncbi:ADP-ribosylglycohydrolase family protein [Streptomyces sp. NPDC000348]|uniref:ADP-ribosylglycohydrolase family protein n=1 Tax=Streptomyces sp. NPDC000348 TaxID=3364538 RepID=UPI003691D8CE